MHFHGNQLSWAIKHHFISLYFKYQSHKYICLPAMNSPIFPSLDDIYCSIFYLTQYLHDFAACDQLFFALSN